MTYRITRGEIPSLFVEARVRKRRTPWTPEEDALLHELKSDGLVLDEIATRLGRSGAAVDSRWYSIRDRTDPTEKPRAYQWKE